MLGQSNTSCCCSNSRPYPGNPCLALVVGPCVARSARVGRNDGRAAPVCSRAIIPDTVRVLLSPSLSSSHTAALRNVLSAPAALSPHRGDGAARFLFLAAFHAALRQRQAQPWWRRCDAAVQGGLCLDIRGRAPHSAVEVEPVRRCTSGPAATTGSLLEKQGWCPSCRLSAHAQGDLGA